jgi:hypothetical protein
VTSARHFQEKCVHGRVVAQCRCPDPNKTVTVVACPDDAWHEGLIRIPADLDALEQLAEVAAGSLGADSASVGPQADKETDDEGYDRAKAGDVRIRPEGSSWKQCLNFRADHRGLMCTRRINHAGQHVAEGTKRVLDVWPNAAAPTGDAEPDRRGIYAKFRVERTDGKSAPGEKHDGCEYFVLDRTHDRFAAAALRAYAEACRDEYPQLAADLLADPRVAASRPLPDTIQARELTEDEPEPAYGTRIVPVNPALALAARTSVVANGPWVWGSGRFPNWELTRAELRRRGPVYVLTPAGSGPDGSAD